MRVRGPSRLMSQTNQVQITAQQMVRLTFWVKVQLCSEAERTDGDVGGDPQQEVHFERFLRIFLEHEFIDRDERGARCLWKKEL